MIMISRVGFGSFHEKIMYPDITIQLFTLDSTHSAVREFVSLEDEFGIYDKLAFITEDLIWVATKEIVTNERDL